MTHAQINSDTTENVETHNNTIENVETNSNTTKNVEIEKRIDMLLSPIE
ncbi:15620_t:CDS:1, partial [Gigaspora rosea]